MKIVIMRHGEAEHFADSDAQRALTPFGRAASKAVAEACAKQGLAKFDKALVSPYLRAQQTWQEISTHFEALSIEECADITPYGDSPHVVEYLNAIIEVEKLETVLLVSHLPLVGYLTAELVADIAPPMFPTSGLACIDYDPISGKGELLWNINP